MLVDMANYVEVPREVHVRLFVKLDHLPIGEEEVRGQEEVEVDQFEVHNGQSWQGVDNEF